MKSSASSLAGFPWESVADMGFCPVLERYELQPDGESSTASRSPRTLRSAASGSRPDAMSSNLSFDPRYTSSISLETAAPPFCARSIFPRCPAAFVPPLRRAVSGDRPSSASMTSLSVWRARRSRCASSRAAFTSVAERNRSPIAIFVARSRTAVRPSTLPSITSAIASHRASSMKSVAGCHPRLSARSRASVSAKSDSLMRRARAMLDMSPAIPFCTSAPCAGTISPDSSSMTFRPPRSLYCFDTSLGLPFDVRSSLPSRTIYMPRNAVLATQSLLPRIMSLYAPSSVCFRCSGRNASSAAWSKNALAFATRDGSDVSDACRSFANPTSSVKNHSSSHCGPVPCRPDDSHSAYAALASESSLAMRQLRRPFCHPARGAKRSFTTSKSALDILSR